MAEERFGCTWAGLSPLHVHWYSSLTAGNPLKMVSGSNPTCELCMTMKNPVNRPGHGEYCKKIEWREPKNTDTKHCGTHLFWTYLPPLILNGLSMLCYCKYTVNDSVQCTFPDSLSAFSDNVHSLNLIRKRWYEPSWPWYFTVHSITQGLSSKFFFKVNQAGYNPGATVSETCRPGLMIQHISILISICQRKVCSVELQCLKSFGRFRCISLMTLLQSSKWRKVSSIAGKWSKISSHRAKQ